MISDAATSIFYHSTPIDSKSLQDMTNVVLFAGIMLINFFPSYIFQASIQDHFLLHTQRDVTIILTDPDSA
jgi:hypothetical protein